MDAGSGSATVPGVLLYDRFDIWLVAPDGTRARRLTEGREEKIRHRISRASFHEDDDGALDPARPLYLALYGDRTKKTGYGRLRLGPAGRKRSGLDVLLWDDKQFGSLARARDTDRYSFTVESYDDSPDLFVANGSKLGKARKVTSTNAHQDDFLWGRLRTRRLHQQERQEAPGHPDLPRRDTSPAKSTPWSC